MKKLKNMFCISVFNVYAKSRLMVSAYIMQYEQNAFAMSIL